MLDYLLIKFLLNRLLISALFYSFFLKNRGCKGFIKVSTTIFIKHNSLRVLMKKGLFILIGIFVLSILSINFISAICLGSNTASCPTSSCNYPSCTSVDNSYCTDADVPSGDCDNYPLKEACEFYGCEWIERLSCYRTNCVEVVGESNCNNVPGCNWVDGSGQFALADADQAAFGHGDSIVCRPSVDISADLGSAIEWLYDDLWSDAVYVHHTSGSTNLGIIKYDTSTLALPFIDYPAQSIWNDEIIIGEPATSGYGSVKSFFSLAGAIKYPNHLSWIYDQGYIPFIHVSHDDFDNFCTANNQIIYYYAYMYIEDTYYADEYDPLFVMYADDDAWINIYAYSPDGRAAGMEGTGQLKNKYSCYSDWGENYYDAPNGVTYCWSGYWSGWYVIEIALQEDGGDQELFVGVKGNHNFADYIGYLGWDVKEVYETCDRLAGENFGRTDCDDYSSYAACMNSGYDFYEAECCGDDGASDIGIINENKRCAQCTATVSGVGNIGDYVWVPILDGDNDGVDDDCDGQTDEDICPLNPNECADQEKTCGPAIDNCGNILDCGSCPTTDCPTCKNSGGVWCEDIQGTTNDICAYDYLECNFAQGTIIEVCSSEIDCDGKVCGPDGVEGTCPPGCPAPTCIDAVTLETQTCDATGESCSTSTTDCSDTGRICKNGACIEPSVLLDSCESCINSGRAWCLDEGDNRCIDFPPSPLETCNIYTPVIDNCPPPTGTPNLYLADTNGVEITTTDVDGNRLIKFLTKNIDLKLIAENSGLPQGPTNFQIWEEDRFFFFDDEIDLIVPGTVDSNGKAVADWTLTQIDIDNAASDDNDDNYEFYFKLIVDGNTLESNKLYVEERSDPIDCDGILRCEDYTPQGQVICENDDCEKGAIDCDPLTEICECRWIDNECKRQTIEEQTNNTNICMHCIDDVNGDWCDMSGGIDDYCDELGLCMGDVISNSALCTIDSAIGTCVYTTDDSIDPEGCENDGYLIYNYAGSWDWNDINDYGSGADPDGGDFIRDGVWRYDPLRMSVGCNADSGTNEIICPAQIELPFFGTWGILVTIGLIILIYVALNLKSHKPEKRKK